MADMPARFLLVLAPIIACLPATAGAAPRGFGADTRGGRDGQVIRVTALAGAGPGSLREALTTKGPRIVVFEVGGVIDLECKRIKVEESFLTVAGETAPEPGITVMRGCIVVVGHDIVLRHLRVRPGDAGRAKRSGWEPDGITTAGANAYNVLIDQCSVTWAVDENVSVSGPRHEGTEGTSRKVTIRNCIIAEGLHDSSHKKGPHSKGTLIHDHCTDIAIVGNLYAHNVDRNPRFKGDTTGVVVNNVVYNPAACAIRAGGVAKEYAGQEQGPGRPRLAVAGNVFQHGPNTKRGLAFVLGECDVWMNDNAVLGRSGKTGTSRASSVKLLTKEPLWPEGLTAMPAAEVLEHVLRGAGARPAFRDAIDQRIVDSVRNGTGSTVHSQEDVGGYPKHPSTHRPLTIPDDNIDAWLAEFARQVERGGR